MRLLVTGGAGFVGSNFIRYYLRAHPETSILNVDKLTYAGNLENLCGLDSATNYRFVCADIVQRELVDRLLDDSIDAVIHFAAESHVDRSIADATDFVRTNVQGTYTLMEAAHRKRVPRFLHISTDEVYGSLAPDEVANEEAALRPNSPYAASKAAADLLVRSFCKTYGFPAIVTRCSNNYGPYQFPEKLIPLMITNALEGNRLPVYGNGLNERDWIFVEDHCRALDRVLAAGRPGEIYNIGSGQSIRNLELVRRVLNLLGRSDDLIEFVMDRPGHDQRYALDTRKISQELGWSVTIGLEEGLARTVEWYRSHPAWVEKTKSGEYLAYYDKFYRNRRQFLAQL